MPVVIPLPHLTYDEDGLSQVYAYGSANNQETTLYTVAAGKAAYMTEAIITSRNTAAGFLLPRLRIYTSTPALAHEITMVAYAAFPMNVVIPFYPPVQLPASYSVRIYSQNANIDVYGAIRLLLKDV